jgi:hypothetical protein
VHTPPVQAADALWRLQVAPQAPQLFGLVLMLVSQPSAGLPLQSAKPNEHTAMVQAPPVHDAIAPGRLHV